MKCGMQRSQNKIVRFLFNAPSKLRVGANKFKTLGLLPVDYRVEQLKLAYMLNIINVKAPEYFGTNVEMVHHRYPTRASNLACERFWANFLLLYKHMPLEQPAYRNKTISI